MGVEPLTALGLGPQTFLGVYDGHGGAEASAFLWQRLHVAVAEALEEAAPRITAALQQEKEAERKEASAVGMSGALGAVPDCYDIDEAVAAVAEVGRGGGGEAMRCADRDDGGGSGVGVGGGGWLTPTFFSSGNKGLVLPIPPVAPAPTGGVAAGGGGDPAAEDRAAGRDTGLSVGGAGSGTGTRGGEELGAGGGGGVNQTSPQRVHGVNGGSDGREWRWGSREPTAMTAVPSQERVAIATERQSSAPSLPQEWLLGARAMADSGARALLSMSGCDGDGDGVGALPDCGGSVEEGGRKDWDFAAGGEAASGVHTEKDGAGGMQGGSCVDIADGSADYPATSSGGTNNCWMSGSGGMRWDSGRESPFPPSGGRSGAQSPGGGPSRSLATAGLPAEGGGGTRSSGSTRGSRSMLQEERPTAVDRYVRGFC